MEITSPAFKSEARIPSRYTGEGADVSPPLEWSHVPSACKSLAIICDDVNAGKTGRGHPFNHWLIYNIPPSISSLQEGIEKSEEIQIPLKMDQGINSFGEIGYTGPLPPPGDKPHHYRFTIFALDIAVLELSSQDQDTILEAMRGHIIATAQLSGTYQRTQTRSSELSNSHP